MRKHEYIISSERSHRREDEYRNTMWTDTEYHVGDQIMMDGLTWTVEEVIK